MSKEITISQMRTTIQTEVLSNKEVFNALAQNTFKGLDSNNVPKALLEGMMRGYSIKDFMTKKIYATPFWNGREQRQDYALVQSIADVRSIAMRSGQSGKSKPEFTFDENKKLESCSITVWKRDGDDRGYTATVFFEEYEKPAAKSRDGKIIPGMWQTKPKTMISKVAEMHALRMAFPEQLSEAYIEEEFDRENVIHLEPSEDYQTEIDGIETLEELQAYYQANKGKGKEFDQYVKNHKAKIEGASSGAGN